MLTCNVIVLDVELCILLIETTYTLAMYKNMETEILNEYPFRVKFDREQAIDSGGVSRDFCSAFWEVAYEKAFDGNILLSPALYSNVNL